MAMLISKFHRLIQSKLLWLAFLVIIIFSFVVWGTQMPSQNRAAEEASSPGKLFGKHVSQEQFRTAYLNTYLSIVMMVGQQINITPQIDEQLRRLAWQRIVTLDQAKKMGIIVTDDDVAQAIQSFDGFAGQDGRFNKAGYKNFVNTFLFSLGFTELQFEEQVREEIALQKIKLLFERGVLVSPTEVRRAFSAISDRFKIEYVMVTPEVIGDEITVTKADAKAYYDKNPSFFTIPEKVRVQYVRIPISSYLDKAQVTDDEVKEYYDAQLDEFIITNRAAAATNALADGTEAAPATETDMATNRVASESPPADATTDVDIAAMATTGAVDAIAGKYLPFEAVAADITNILRRRAAESLAADRAMELVTELTPDREGIAPTFEEVAARADLKVRQLKPFALRDELDEIDAGPEFNRAAFALEAGPENYYSDPIKGSNYIYIAALVERIPKRIPDFDEVEFDARLLARQQMLEDALAAKAKEMRDAAEAAVKNGETFASALKPFGVEPIVTEEFTASVGATTNQYNDLLIRGILTRNQGEVTELLPSFDAVLFAYVAQRTPGDPTTLESLKPQIIGSLRRQHTRTLFEAWQEHLLKQAQFEERPREAPAEDPDEEEQDDV